MLETDGIRQLVEKGEEQWLPYFWFWERRFEFVPNNPDFIPRPGEVALGKFEWQYRRKER